MTDAPGNAAETRGHRHAAGDADTVVITAGHRDPAYWANLWRYRELLYFLAWRDLLVRYKQTVVGVSWAVLKPLVAIGVFTVIFGRLAALPSEGVPYPVLVFAALLPWQFFASVLADCSNSLVGAAGLVSKVYFPRLLVPASTVVVGLVDLCIPTVMLLGLLAWYRIVPDWHLLTLPFFVGIAGALAFGAGLWFAVLNVEYRDFRYIVGFAMQLGMYLSPVGFSSTIVPERWRLLYSLNPMVGVIDGFRWALLRGETMLYLPGLLLSLGLVLLLLVSGVWFFRRTERRFADVI